MINYNYYCLDTYCDKNKIIIRKEEINKDTPEYCPKCNSVLKRLGISTSIVHVGTRESKINK